MSRKRKGNLVEWKVSVPAEIALNIEYLLFDPETEEPAYGARSRLITKLLETYWQSLSPETRAKVLLGKQQAEESQAL